MKTHSLNITPELLRLISEIDEFKGSWKATHSLAPQRLESLRHVATIESIGSSTRIEGSKLTDKEVEVLLANISHCSFATRDEQEVAGYAELAEVIFDSHEDIQLTDNYIKQLHAMLLRHSSKDERHRGQYKTLHNHVEAFDSDGKSLGVVFKTATPFETPLKMQELIFWTRESLADNSLHPLLVIGVFAVVFLQIHPFQDGNGRLSRLLTTLLLLKAGYPYVRYSSLESIIERNKEGYYLALRRTQGSLENNDPDWLPWTRFFLISLKAQKDHLATKVDKLNPLQELPSESLAIMDYVRQHGRITTGEAEALTKAPRPTVKKRLSDLVRDGHLARHGKGRGSWYRSTL